MCVSGSGFDKPKKKRKRKKTWLGNKVLGYWPINRLLNDIPYLKITNTTRKSHFEKGMLPCYSQDLKYHTEEGIAITYGYW